MKKSLLTLTFILLIMHSLFSQVYLVKQWDHTYGGIDREDLTALMMTSDGGFILGGYTVSDSSSNISQPSRGARDYWVVKTDSLGVLLWEKRFGGSIEDRLFSVDETNDGGYIFGGIASSDMGGDVTEPTKGSFDYWIVKTDAAGNKLWDRRYGGADYDWLNYLQQTDDGGFILGGYTYSDSTGDVSQHTKGGEDFWVVKTDSAGNKLWDRRFGGDLTEEMFSLDQTSDGGFVLGGRVVSDSTGDVSQHTRGSTDYWVVKINSSGSKVWDRRFGGDDRDYLVSLIQTFDGGYILAGYTISENNGDISQPSRDTSFTAVRRGDFWVVKIDSAGNKQWDKRYGGHWIEDSFGYIRQTSDSGYILGGSSYSNISGEKSENNFGYEQCWILKIDTIGNIIWDKTIFTNGEDEYAFPIPVSDSCYVIGCFSFADISGYKTENSKGYYDYWMVKFCESTQPQLPVADFTVSLSEICKGGCVDFDNFSTNAGSYQWYFPGAATTSSTSAFPTNICYPNSGSYDVTLIAINNSGNDTLTIPGMVTVHLPPLVTITQTPDTLYATPGFVHYQWYLNGAPLINDTNNYFVYSQNGEYFVSVTDSNFCTNRDTLLINVGISDYSDITYKINVYPNPTQNLLNVEGLEITKDGELRIHDILGRSVYTSKIVANEIHIPVSDFKPGIYILEVLSNEQKYFVRFIKN